MSVASINVINHDILLPYIIQCTMFCRKPEVRDSTLVLKDICCLMRSHTYSQPHEYGHALRYSLENFYLYKNHVTTMFRTPGSHQSLQITTLALVIRACWVTILTAFTWLIDSLLKSLVYRVAGLSFRLNMLWHVLTDSEKLFPMVRLGFGDTGCLLASFLCFNHKLIYW